MTSVMLKGDQMAAHTAADSAPNFAGSDPLFIDFGCGTGNSIRFAEGIMGGAGVGLDISADRVAQAAERGYEVAVGDLLAFTGRSVATASFAIDLFPEFETRRAWETALVTMLRAARDFVFIQHLCFDSAEALLARGQTSAAHAAKSVALRPRAVDYLHFVQQHRAGLNIVGFAAFGIGEANGTPSAFEGITGSLLDSAMPAFRSARIIIARKQVSRFRAALQRAGSGQLLLYWEQPA
ncbi:MAG: class I SAM-dependent methyltransferase [Pseudomonadota bacterium]